MEFFLPHFTIYRVARRFRKYFGELIRENGEKKVEKWAMENYNDAPIRMRLFHIFLKLLLLFCITHTLSRFKYTTFDNKLC